MRWIQTKIDLLDSKMDNEQVFNILYIWNELNFIVNYIRDNEHYKGRQINK